MNKMAIKRFHKEVKTSAYHLNFLNPERITYGRELRGLTKKALAKMIDKTASALTQYEVGLKPSIDTFYRISEALHLPLSFFSVEKEVDLPPPALEEFHFRARASATQAMKTKSRRYAESVIAIYRFLEEYGVEFPKENVTPVQKEADGLDVPAVAALARKLWGLGELPVRDLFPLLETNGIFIVLLDQEYNALEACATWFGDRPCIMLAHKHFEEAASRIHFDLSHELGHLILHDESFAETVKEPQAHEFASAFLMPAENFLQDSPQRWNLELFLDVKNKWRVSIQAALRRARDLGIISDASYRWGMIDLSKQGFRVKEPGEFVSGQPSLLAQAIKLVKDSLTLDELAAGVFMYPDEVENLLLAQKVNPDDIEAMKKQPEKEMAVVVSFKREKD